MDELSKQHCIPCEEGGMPMQIKEAQALMEKIPGWNLSSDARILHRDFTFKDFKEALTFTNKVGDIAEREGHHPDLSLGWGRVSVELCTHSVGGLTMNDFVLAAQINDIQKV